MIRIALVKKSRKNPPYMEHETPMNCISFQMSLFRLIDLAGHSKIQCRKVCSP
ncbi:hypothetical protein PIROE2DRAFT_12619 [Piromyces sp. E2]|nr:hypothetical protein PIROE2DRAFT_12619 [Piromyces sp. E2]|eukprot:OUM61369.1 hypothetical protein PIROE2DRAFT_12619 [Piromyces sp. E2]